MATSEENNLIGYDPLAWMEVDTDKNEDHLVTDDLIGNTDENAILNITKEDELVIDKVDDENVSAFIEEMADDYSMDANGIVPQEADADDSVPEEVEDSLIDLDATLTIQNVVKLHERLKNLLAMHDEIEINASDVSSIDTATLQLLVSLKKDAVKLQKKVTIIYPSPRFVESAQLLGLLDVLDVHDA
ncbi:MAG: STAS domain-containing protein [Methylobacter sp.]|uniref:STAS domain-containing protein n=1 Tax=Methylobacter sp. TaxID=2051955 RepID=UPI00272FAB81|nr:STAS domain-containing protein [Methylobacter sp.]MDP1665322.1 STAS domain-containing protein [Methylobacter sp.]MDP1970569.1 STAS domain-containing protein [Methylobacter sp.]